MPKRLLVVVLQKIARWGLHFGKNVWCAKLYFHCAPKLVHSWWP